MKVADLVNDKRCEGTMFGKAGIILAIVGDTCWVMWPDSPEMPLWAPEFYLELISESR
mgnify:CR=1 FL=1